MWCAVHVRDGSETKTEAFVSGLLPQSLNARCFHLTRRRRKKYGGEWRTIQENLMPGYVFIDTDQPEAVHKELEQTTVGGLLFGSREFVATLEAQESDFMECIMNENGEIGLSRVRIAEDGGIRYLSGPLVKVGHLVRKLDLHRRVAEIETSFLGQKHILYLGIEIAE